MFNTKSEYIVITRNIRTRRHAAVVYETCIPMLEKYKKVPYTGVFMNGMNYLLILETLIPLNNSSNIIKNGCKGYYFYNNYTILCSVIK